MILNRAHAFPNAEAPSVSRDGIPSSSRNSLVSETTEQLPVMILDETSKSFPIFNTKGRSFLIKFKTPGKEEEPTLYIKECITALTNYIVDKVLGKDLVGF